MSSRNSAKSRSLESLESYTNVQTVKSQNLITTSNGYISLIEPPVVPEILKIISLTNY